MERIPEGWKLEGGKLMRVFRFPSFQDAVWFFLRVSREAHRRNHHPDLHVSYRHVICELWTHSAGGVTEKDLELAEVISRIYSTPLGKEEAARIWNEIREWPGELP